MTPALPYRIENPHRSHACISDIFSQGNSISRLGEHLVLHPGVTFARNRLRIISGQSRQEKIGKKRPIVNFSDKSRRNMMVTMAKMEEPFRFWQDFTFADDVMQELSIAERAKYSSRCLKRLKQWMDRMDLKIAGVWKREWVKRKSGKLMGEYIPHFHMVYNLLPGMDRKSFVWKAVDIASEWVSITGTRMEEKALAVSFHRKSYRFIESRKEMQKCMSKYLVKYLVKDEGFSDTESIGRNWGLIGSPKITEGEIIDVTEREMILFKRCLRKITRRARGFFKTALNEQHTKFFVFIERSTVVQYLEWLRIQYNFEGVPF